MKCIIGCYVLLYFCYLVDDGHCCTLTPICCIRIILEVMLYSGTILTFVTISDSMICMMNA